MLLYSDKHTGKVVLQIHLLSDTVKETTYPHFPPQNLLVKHRNSTGKENFVNLLRAYFCDKEIPHFISSWTNQLFTE